MDSRWVFGVLGPSPVASGRFAIKFVKPARFTSGAELVDNTKFVAALFAAGDARGDGDGDVPALLRGVSSRLIVLVSTPASAGAWREFKLTTPPRVPDESL